ncbi:hypothetical protein F2Q70_00015003 [Brassica cretica]|uniref:Uncharacterized protein n=1 Tax=Brassica cretica TaxID=69181 RepID=A0A8S9HVV2_BRACR|nr:hypothetical protein F2Q70_00015003 [Brassica cretica]
MRNDWLHVDSRTFTLVRLYEQFISLVLKVFCEIEAGQESKSRASGGLRTWFIGVVFDTVDENLGRFRPCGTIRACSKAHYRSESVKFHWLLDFSSLGVVLVDILEESNSATELLRFLGHMAHCFRGERSSFDSSSFCIRDRTRCHYWRRATCRSFVFHELVRGRFVSASLGFRELDSSRDFCVAFGLELHWMGDRPVGGKEEKKSAIWSFPRRTIVWSSLTCMFQR